MGTDSQSAIRKRPYFFWDYDLSEEEVHEILAGDDVHRKAWVISRILNAAFWDDIWKYITVDDIRAHWDLLRFRTPYLRELWAHALEVWSRDERGSVGEGVTGRGGEGVRERLAVYGPEPAPELQPGILTPLQQAFLTRFFAYDVGQQFFLTGGTALAAFYLYHRLSTDLDLFTVDDEAFGRLEPELGRLGRELHCTVSTTVSTPAFHQVVLTAEDGARLKVDLVRDIDAQFGEHPQAAGMIIDSLLNIAVNKVTAIFGRTDVKDFVDLYFLLARGYDLEELFELAREKDAGFTPFFFAGMLRQIHKVKDLPVMLKPIDLETLVAFYDNLADRLLARHTPPPTSSMLQAGP